MKASKLISLDQQLNEYVHLDLDFESIDLDINNSILQDFAGNPVMSFLATIRNIDYLPFTCKHIFGIDLGPHQAVVLKKLFLYDNVTFIASRGFSKSFLLALYILIVMLIRPNIKIVVVGGGFRQAKIIGQYCESIIKNAPVFRSMLQGQYKIRKGNDKWSISIGSSTALFLPLGDGGTIRGERANITIADEFSVIALEVFNTVVRGFGATSSDPMQNVRRMARINKMKKLGIIDDLQAKKMESGIKSNKIIISGTADYAFNQFCAEWKKNKRIVERGESDEDDGLIDPKDICIIRIPHDIVPEGFLDKKTIGSTKETLDDTTYLREYCAVFPEDSNGFYPRSLIEKCVVKEPREIGHDIVQPFSAQLKGNKNAFHIMGVDPASSDDNFSIVILEVHPTYRKVVYCWTVKKSKLDARIQRKQDKQQTYYGFCARKIRQLMKLFPNTQVIALDAQGGGEMGVAEALADKDKFEYGELPIYPVQPHHPLSDGKDRHTDSLSGEHIIELVQFARAEYTSQANHGMKADLIDGILLFPFFDAVSLARAEYEDAKELREIDNLETCMFEIEALKEELSTIQHTQSEKTNRDQWNTPEVKKADNKKGRLRKDRYSALVMANAAARRLQNAPETIRFMNHVGGFASETTQRKSDTQKLYVGSDLHVQGMTAVGKMVQRR